MEYRQATPSSWWDIGGAEGPESHHNPLATSQQIGRSVVEANGAAFKRADDAPMAQDNHPPKTARMTLGVEGKPGHYTPRLHVLMSDGRVTEFKSTTVVIPESPRDEADTEVYGLLVNGRGEPWVDARGDYILLPAQPLLLRGDEGPDTPLTWKEVARRAGISHSSVKRAVQAGELQAPGRIGKRSTRFRLGDVESWIEKQKKRRAG
jgi:excisionase family DNA binding protein